MKWRLTAILLLAVVSTGCSSTDQANVDPEVAAAKQEAEKALGYKCKREKTTGSIMPKRRCSTAAQREESRRLAKEMLDNRQSHTGSNGGQ